jgi:hypothetical protein
MVMAMKEKIIILIQTLFLLVFVKAASAAEIPVNGGPRELVIAYHSEPIHRAAFRAYLSKDEVTRLATLRNRGVLDGYQILFNSFVTPRTWDALIILKFAHYSDTEKWKEIERSMPGGLDRKGLALAKPIETVSADLSWEGSASQADSNADGVFYVIPYKYNVLDQYKKFVDAYVVPQVTAWIADGALTQYRIYLNRDSVDSPWDALFVYKYRDLDAFGRREELLAKTRVPLRNDPAWKAMNDIKSTIRTEYANTIAESLSDK